MDWAQGYVSQIEYTHGYYGELAPSLIDFACLSRGVSTRASGRPVKYLELGFGQGSSLCVHAAAVPGEFYGTDFLPAHAFNARQLAEASGRHVGIFEDSFQELLDRDELPEFDIIAAHGVWSWISAENRKAIVEIVRRKLAPGGVFYVSYNCLPGAARELPLRHLLKLHTDVASPSVAEAGQKIDAALDFVDGLLDAGSSYLSDPEIKTSLEQLRGKSKGYVAHEYLNRDWHPSPFSEVAGELALAKLEFAASAQLMHHLDGAGAPEKARRLLSEAKHPVLRETIRDYLTNQRFRRDIFVKGLRPMAPATRAERLDATAFVLLAHPDQLPRKLAFPYGQAELNQDVHGALIAVFAQDSFAPKSLQRLRQSPLCKSIPANQFLPAIRMLVGAGQLHPVQSEEARVSVSAACGSHNRYVLEQAARSKEEMCALASPVTGSGVRLHREPALFLHALSLGYAAQEAWAQHALARQAALGLQLLRDGEPVKDPAENLAKLRQDAEDFAKTSLPVLRALGVA